MAAPYPNRNALARLLEWTRGAVEGAGETALPLPASALTSRTGAARLIGGLSPVSAAIGGAALPEGNPAREASRAGARATMEQVEALIKLRLGLGAKQVFTQARDAILATREVMQHGTPRQKGLLAGELGGVGLGMAVGKLPKGMGISQIRVGEKLYNIPPHLRYWAHVAEQAPTPEVFASQLSTFRRSFEAAMTRGEPVPTKALLTHPEVARHFADVGDIPVQFNETINPLQAENTYTSALSWLNENRRIELDPRSMRGQGGRQVESPAQSLLEEITHQQQKTRGREYQHYERHEMSPKLLQQTKRILKKKGMSDAAITESIRRLRTEGVSFDNFSSMERYRKIPQEVTAKRSAAHMAEFLAPTTYGDLPVASPEEFWQLIHYNKPIPTGRRRTP